MDLTTTPLWMLLAGVELGMIMLGLMIICFNDAYHSSRSHKYWERQEAPQMVLCGAAFLVTGLAILVFAGEELTQRELTQRELLLSFLTLVAINLVLFAALRQWD